MGSLGHPQNQFTNLEQLVAPLLELAFLVFLWEKMHVVDLTV